MICLQGDAYRLSEFEEAAGRLKNFWKFNDDFLIAVIGPTSVLLPINLEQELKPLLGQKVAVLRTDIPNKRYLVRVMSDKKVHETFELDALAQESLAELA